VLKKIQRERGDFELEEIDVLRHPRTALRAGITMIPALEDGGRRLSGILLGSEQIRGFIEGKK